MKRKLNKLIGVVTLASMLISTVGVQKAYAGAIKVEESNRVSSVSTEVPGLGRTDSEGGHYATNPDGNVGKEKTINVDGDCSDWDESMIIARGLVNDSPLKFLGNHENRVADSYAMYGAYDDQYLYVAWENVNVADVCNGSDGAINEGKMSDYGVLLGIKVSGNENYMNGYIDSSTGIWNMKCNFKNDINYVYAFHADGTGEPGFFTPDTDNKDDDGRYYTNYKGSLLKPGEIGILSETSYGTIVSKTLYGIKNMKNDQASVDKLYDESVQLEDFMPEHTKLKGDDQFFEVAIPLSVLGIDKGQVESNGVGVMMVQTNGLSGLDCLPHDPTVLDNAIEQGQYNDNTSKEKDDEDIFTVPVASIGKLMSPGSVTPTVKNPSISSFAPDVETATVDQEVKFTCTASNAKSYEFTIDGEAVDDSEVSKNVLTHTFTKEGEHKVAVTAKGESGTKDATKEITFNVTKKEDPEDPVDPVDPEDPVGPEDPEDPTEDEKELKIDSFTSDVQSPQKVDSKIKFTAKASDGKGDLSYKFTAMNTETSETEDINEDTTSNVAEWVPSEAGEYTIKVEVSDGTNTKTESMKYVISDKDTKDDGDQSQDKDTIKISNISISPEAGEAMEEYKITVDASGAKNLKYTFKVNGAKKQSGVSNEYLWVPVKAGDYKIEVEVSGDNAETVTKSESYTITAVDDGDDEEKTLNVELGSDSGTNVEKNSKVKLLASVDNAEGDCTFVYKVNGKQVSTGDKDDNSAYTWTPVEAGTYNITVEVTDEDGNKGVSKELVIKVTDSSSTDEPGDPEETSDTTTALPIIAFLGATVVGSLMIKKRN